MKQAIIFIIIVLSCCRANAQTLTGVVYDKITNQPIPYVFVYLDGTSFSSNTDDSGKFELTVKNILNTKLVLHHASYQSLIIEAPFENLPEKIYMEERLNVLNETIIQADRFTHAQKLKAFREQFLGMTRAGRSCKIMNEDDIRIWYDLETKTLSASSEQPLVVINEYTGYEILFTLVVFQAVYPYVTLDSDKVLRSFFAVTTSYSDLSPNDRRIKRRRDELYERSSNFFFKNLANNTLKEAGFRLYKDARPIELHLHFTMKDTLSLKMIRLIPEAATLSMNRKPERRYINAATSPSFSVLYRRRQSDIKFLTDTLLVDQYGNINQIDKVLFSGLMGESRAGNMLPLDYEP